MEQLRITNLDRSIEINLEKFKKTNISVIEWKEEIVRLIIIDSK